MTRAGSYDAKHYVAFQWYYTFSAVKDLHAHAKASQSAQVHFVGRLMPRTKHPVKKRIKIIGAPCRAPDLPTQINLPTLAKLLGIEITAARELVECGIIIRGNPGLYVLEHSVASYCACLRKIAAIRSGL